MSQNKNNRRRLTIAVDGFSSCGKSTFAKALAARFGYIFVDTGAMYRAVTLFALENGAIRSGIVDEEALVALLPKIDIAFRFNPKRGASDIYVNGDLVEGKIRTIEVSNCVSRVSSIGEVREKLVAMQQQMVAMQARLDAYEGTNLTQRMAGGMGSAPSPGGGVADVSQTEGLGGREGAAEHYSTKNARQRVAESTAPA